ncbi:cytochrome P450 4d2-like isoform X3 [Nymphalis io]|uniref:cytochrome P450 4d2-like isoform X1 n=1 Tax=Inachis io TaxID=171585 RepID=UPI002169B26E|nr:cytochrome P450 4d2-like isoform X1 [Nymphalis io]XP_050343068.1 cytochrome P450 4d2-like isoform X2 [Nymphalis io]XP_050343069.1 cytochrome P450 4d2-like isoform X3 [Nymphalis io]
MIAYFLLTIFVLWFILFRYRRRRMYKLASVIPAPKGDFPVIGITSYLAGSTEDIMLTMQRFSYSAMENDGIIKGWLNHILYFLVCDPVDLEMILKTCLEKDDLHRFMRKVIGYGSIFAPVSIWRRRRKIIIPAFSPKIIENFFDVFSEHSVKLVEKLANKTGTGYFSIYSYLTAYTLDSVCETAMGVKLNAQNNSNSPFVTSLNQVLAIICKRIFHLWLQPDWLFKLFPQYSKHEACIKILHDFTDEVIQNKRAELKKEKDAQPEDQVHYNLDDYQRKNLLEQLIHLSGCENGYTDLELREEILTLSIAGTDTTAHCIGYTLQLLSKYPEIQDKVYEELCTVLEDSKRPIVKDDLQKLKYLERVVKESLRLFPPVPFIIRKVERDIALPSGRVLPSGSGVVVSIWGCHRDPKYWGSDAEHFDPDRFLPERLNLKHACSFMPFSNGPRNCVGYQYALMSIKTILATLLRNYKVVGEPEKGPIPHIKVKLNIMMKAVDEYQLALEKRTP